ncbi:MAG TPA: DUF3054 domain-containing protein [Ktedonobacteraceae bacterium]
MSVIEDRKNSATEEKSSARAPVKKGGSAYRRIAVLVSGDALAFLAFAAIGRGSHGEETGLAAIPQVILTALPFAIAWFIVAPFVGVYRGELMDNPRKMAARTLSGWALSWPVAMALRGIFVDHAVPPWTFALIALVVNAVLLLIWRWPYALNNSLKRRA